MDSNDETTKYSFFAQGESFGVMILALLWPSSRERTDCGCAEVLKLSESCYDEKLIFVCLAARTRTFLVFDDKLLESLTVRFCAG